MLRLGQVDHLNRLLLIAGALASAIVGAALFASPGVAALDFHAFYCAGHAMRLHADPYLAQSLHGCESQAAARSFRFYDASVTLPAPLPPYALAIFSLLSLLTFGFAKIAWGGILGAAIFIAAVALARVARLSPVTVLCALLPTLIAPSLALGQLVPVYCAAAFSAMLFAQQRRYVLAAFCASVALIEPHLGIPLWLSLFVWVRGARLTLLSCGAIAAVISVAIGGFAANAEYIAHVVPLQALAEVPADGQLSLAVVLHAFGAPDRAAVAAGSVSYVFVVIASIFAAPRLAARFQNSAFLLAAPAAGSLIGGSYVHGTDVVAALPLALLLANAAPKRLSFAACAVYLLVVPWWSAIEASTGLQTWFVLSAICGGYVLWDLTGSVAAATALALFACATLYFSNIEYARDALQHLRTAHAAANLDARFPEATWADAVRQRFATGAAVTWCLRAFTWVGLLMLCVRSFNGVALKAVSRPYLRN